MSKEGITIYSFEELKEKMKTLAFYVEWTVYSEFGPDWIGSCRKIEFSLGYHTLADSGFYKEIEKKLVMALEIPETSKDLVISGKGSITLVNDKLEIEYDWDAAVPYDEPKESGEGQKFFYP